MDQKQDLVVKVEDEFGIFVKEEESIVGVSINENFDENESVNLDDLLMVRDAPFNETMLKEPVIYTTKVDDMLVFKQIKSIHLHPNNVLDSIVRESKPAWTGQFKKKKKRKCLTKLNKFVKNLLSYNIMVSEYNRTKQQIITKTLVQENPNTVINIDDSDSTSESDTEEITSKSTDDAVVIIPSELTRKHSKPRSRSTRTNTSNTDFICFENLKEKSSNYMIVINTLRLLLNEVYFVNNDGIPTDFYRLEDEKLSLIARPNIIKIHLYNCCWYMREQKIKNKTLQEFSTALQAFMRTSHACYPEKCECCCKRKCGSALNIAYEPRKRKKVLLQNRNYFQSQWHQRLLIKVRTNPSPQNNIIDTALAHKPKRKNVNKVNSRNRNTYLNLQVNENRSLTYCFKDNGLIDTMVEINCSPGIPFTMNYLKNMICAEDFQFSENVCCLNKYKNYILKLIKIDQFSVAKFLANISDFALDKCVKCKTLEFPIPVANKGSLATIHLPKYPKHSKKVSKKTRPPNRIQTNCSYVDIIEHEIDVVTETKTADLCNHKVNGNTVIHCNCKIRYDEGIPSFIDLGVEDLKLVIFPGGKVKIQTKTLPDNISTENLQILKEILRFASNKLSSKYITETMEVMNLFNNTNLEKSLNKSDNIENASINSKKSITNNIENRVKKSYSRFSQSINKSIPLLRKEGMEKRAKDMYQTFTNINSEKRKQYLTSYEFIRKVGTDLWSNIKISGQQLNVADQTPHSSHIQGENIKRKTAEKGTSPPPKLKRKEMLVQKAPRINVMFPSSSGRATSISKTDLPKDPLPPLIQTEFLRETLMANASNSALSNNVTVIPIAQLPQVLINNLRSQFPYLTESRTLDGQLRNPDQINPKEPPSISNESPLLLPADMKIQIPIQKIMPCNTIPPVGDVSTVKFEPSEEGDKEEDCILGV